MFFVVRVHVNACVLGRGSGGDQCLVILSELLWPCPQGLKTKEEWVETIEVFGLIYFCRKMFG